VSRYQKGKTKLDFTEARDSGWQWHQLGHMQVCTSLQTNNHASTPLLSFLQAGCPSCRPTNSVKALKARERYLEIFQGVQNFKMGHVTLTTSLSVMIFFISRLGLAMIKVCIKLEVSTCTCHEDMKSGSRCRK